MAKNVNGKPVGPGRKRPRPRKETPLQRIRRLVPAEAMVDWRWLRSEVAKGRFQEYAGEFIVAVGQKIVDHDPDYGAVIDRVAKNHGVNPRFMAIVHMSTPDCW